MSPARITKLRRVWSPGGHRLEDVGLVPHRHVLDRQHPSGASGSVRSDRATSQVTKPTATGTRSTLLAPRCWDTASPPTMASAP